MSKSGGGSGKGGAGKSSGANGRSAGASSAPADTNARGGTTSELEREQVAEKSTKSAPASVTPWLANDIRNKAIARLERNDLTKLKAIAKEQGVTPIGDPRKKSTWASAIIDKESERNTNK